VSDAIDRPLGAYCPIEHKRCDVVSDCQFRAHNGECLIKAASVRILGGWKHVHKTMAAIGEALTWNWQKRDRDDYDKHASVADKD